MIRASLLGGRLRGDWHAWVLDLAAEPSLVFGEQGVTAPAPVSGSALTGLLDDLHAVVTGAKPAWSTLYEALRTAAVLDAARRSLTDGGPVTTNGGPA